MGQPIRGSDRAGNGETTPVERAPVVTRRRVLGLAALTGGLAVAGGIGLRSALADQVIGPEHELVAAAEEQRSRSGRVVNRRLRAAATTVELGDRRVRTWAFDDALPGSIIRAQQGDELRVSFRNDLPEPTTIHWHGLALRNDMDGVPDLTMPLVAPGSGFDYRFVLAHPGTYWFHPHVGPQLDTGLYAPLVVEDPSEPGGYDQEEVLVIDDWTDGWGRSPGDLLAEARRNGMGRMDGDDMGGMEGMDGMDGMDMPSRSAPLGSDTGDVTYPAHLLNGRLPSSPYAIRSARGRRIRLRVINAGSDTAYRFAVAGHRLTVTHTDGFPTQPVQVDTLILGMGERYDVVITAGDGVFPIVAVPEGKNDPTAVAVLRTASGDGPDPARKPAELTGRLLAYGDLVASPEVALPPRAPDRELAMTLSMADGGRRWLIDGRAYGDHEPLPVTPGERVRLTMTNQSMMFHPMHLHGHTFALTQPDGRGIRKDTVNVLPMQQLSVDLEADNPGQWLMHCHNTYHVELGMATVMSYRV